MQFIVDKTSFFRDFNQIFDSNFNENNIVVKIFFSYFS